MEERSAGAVVFRNEISGRRYLLLRYHAGHWDFPKGNVEQGESEEEAALREVKEETGLKHVTLVPGFRRVIEYFYTRASKRIHKQVTFFLAETPDESVRISYEHSGYAWLSFSEAVRRATFRNSRNLLKEAESFASRAEAARAFRTEQADASRQA